MLEISNLHVSIGNKEILKGINLCIAKGEVHAIMGPNGSGKSTLSQVLAGKEDYKVTQGTILLNNKNLLDLSPEDRAKEGVFLAFQYPISIPGVRNETFLRTIYNSFRKHQNLPPLDAMDFRDQVEEKAKMVQLNFSLLNRSLNEGFSGGEKKRNEILQMLLLEPSLAVLDETDSGLDIDALRVVSEGVNTLRSPERSFLVITHYQRLLDYIVPDRVHVLANGKIIHSGDKQLAKTLEEKGYGWLEEIETQRTRPLPSGACSS